MTHSRLAVGLLVATFGFTGISISSAYAQKRCPAGDSGCTLDNAADKIKERVDQGAKDVQKAEGPIDKAKEVGKTVKDCVNCGMDAVKSGVSEIKSGAGGKN